MTSPHPVTALLQRLRTEPGAPVIVWYRDLPAERIELSATTLWNYACKAANLLTQDFDVSEESTVALDLPAHWQTAGWLLGVWALGARVVEVPADADIVIAEDSRVGAQHVDIATSLDAWGGPSTRGLPHNVIDAGRELRAQPDVPIWTQASLQQSATAVRNSTGSRSFAALGAMHDSADGNCGYAADNNAFTSATFAAVVARACGTGRLIIVNGSRETRQSVTATEAIGHWH